MIKIEDLEGNAFWMEFKRGTLNLWAVRMVINIVYCKGLMLYS